MFENIFLLAHIIISVLLILLVLLQRSDGGMGALGGEGSGALLSGRGTTNALTKATTILAVLFICSSLFLSLQSVGDARPGSVVDSIEVEETAKKVEPMIPDALPVEGNAEK